MRCPDCKSDNVIPERSSGYAGFRCNDCHKWNYQKDMKSESALKDIELSRIAFEASMVAVAIKHDYSYMAQLLKRHEEGAYKQVWVDSAWIGWCEAVKRYA